MASSAPPYVIVMSPGEPETGLWCSRCLLPSLVRFPIYATSEEGSSEVATGWQCPGCDDGEITYGRHPEHRRPAPPSEET